MNTNGRENEQGLAREPETRRPVVLETGSSFYGKILPVLRSFLYQVPGYSDLFSEDITGPEFVENSPPPPHNLIPVRFGNGLLGWTYGGEIAPEQRPVSWWLLRGSDSYLHMVLVQSGWDLPRRLTLDFDYRFVSRLASPGIAAHSTAGARLAWMVNLELSAVGEFEPSHYEFPSDPGPNVALKQSFCGRIVWTSEPE